MTKKKATPAIPSSYKELHASMSTMNREQLRCAIRNEVNKTQPRVDMLKRLVGKWNRNEGQRVMSGIMGLLSYKGKRDVDAILDSDD